ncbi:hypothetical protein ACA910_010156 [Epithemia clementina (nom. ined.)]
MPAAVLSSTNTNNHVSVAAVGDNPKSVSVPVADSHPSLLGPLVKTVTKPLSEQRIAVIGAGPSGLSVLCAFAAAATPITTVDGESNHMIPKITCFERQSDIGGQWHSTPWRTGLGEYGEPVHSGMYPHLWSNGPKECLEMANYTYMQHFGKALPSYPPRAVLLDYLKGRAEHFDLKKYIQFNTVVRRVTFGNKHNVVPPTTSSTDEQHNNSSNNDSELLSTSSSSFTVVTQDLRTKQETVHEFDYVFCCSGHFHVPHVPTFAGFDDDGSCSFHGRIVHSHDVRSFAPFRNQRLLIIGTSYSAEDIALQAYKFGCRHIILSYRTRPMNFDWPEGMVTRPLLQKVVNGHTAVFIDGSMEENVDVIVLSTGYQHSFPFMEQSLALQTHNTLWIPDLYKGLFWKANPRLIYMAMHDQWLTFSMFDAQAWYARDVILGRMDESQVSIESWKQDMEKWTLRHQHLDLTDDEAMIRFQMDYTADLIAATDYPSWDYEMTVQTLLDWEKAKHENIFTYRDMFHTSAVTGTMGTKPRIPWLENKDDSLQSFINNANNSDTDQAT